MVAADNRAKFLQEAEKHVLHGKVQQAIGEYLKIIKIDANDVLTLNTIGDLHLRQKNIAEANRYFSLVAENYVRNNFFLKAIAVYRKILGADPNNLDINSTIAELYAKQGLSIDARNQYLKVVALLEKAGRDKEVLEVYEKIVDLDPANAAIQRKLAELHLASGEVKQAYAHFAGAAHAQVKIRDYTSALDSFRRALNLNSADVDTLSGFLECCQETGNVAHALDQLKKSIEIAPENLQIRELLGQAHLASNDLETAARIFQMTVSMDESRYEGFFAVAQALIGKGSFDQAIGCLDPIIHILITRRETERAAQLYEQIRELCPTNILPLVKLASIHSATGDQPRYMDAVDKIADHYLEQKCPIEALEFLEKILQVDPHSEKHLKLHQQAFEEAFPDTPYVPPVEQVDQSAAPESSPVREEAEAPVPKASSEIVEVDLLLNYGLKEKALRILQNLEMRDPNSKEVRIRLLSIFKAENKFVEAAEQCLLLAALYRKSLDEDSARDYLDEARQLAPDVADKENLDEFARLRGITGECLSGAASEGDMPQADAEVDLSADLMDIFFVGDQESGSGDDLESEQIADVPPEEMTEEFPHSIQQSPAKSFEEQIQEVDFYIRLGFRDEALAKLNEIAKTDPDNPELSERYKKLVGDEVQAPVQDVVSDFAEPVDVDLSEAAEAFSELQAKETPAGFEIVEMDSSPEAESISESIAAAFTAPSEPAGINGLQPQQAKTIVSPESDGPDFQANEMFADLMEDIGAGDDRNSSPESFEDHFSLGIAYREMDLLDDAIKEFQCALKSADMKKAPQKVIQCCGMLSTCFLRKDMPSSVLRWCQTGLSIADISSHEAMALRYDMGVAHSISGSSERALECFEHIFGMDPSYRDVAQKIDELKSGPNRHVP